MKKIGKLSLLLVPFILASCNNSNVNKTKSPFSDSYNPIGMKGEYNITDSIGTEDYNYLKTAITNYKDNYIPTDDPTYIVSSYTRNEETRDLKAAYFGKNLGEANLCSFLHQETTNARYSNNVTTKLTKAHKENQTLSGGITKANPVVNDYIFQLNDETTGTQDYKMNQQLLNDGEAEIIKKGETKTVDVGSPEKVNEVFGLKAYVEDIKNLSKIKVGEQEITFEVLGDNNNAVYGKYNDKYLIKEAISVFDTYNTVVGDRYKAVHNYFYETLLEKVGKKNFRFTNFRFYKEYLILSEAISDEQTVPIVYLVKPQLVEYSEIKYEINYASSVSSLTSFDKSKIPGNS